MLDQKTECEKCGVLIRKEEMKQDIETTKLLCPDCQ